MPLPWWILLDIYVSVLVGTWLLSSTLVAWMMGLRGLLARYPPVDEPVEQSFHFASGTLHWVTLNNGLYVGIGTRGVHLSPTRSFRSPFFQDIPCIPWSELVCVRFQDDGLFSWLRASRFKVPALDLRFSVRGAAGRAIERKLLALSAGRP
ncbi:MAG: hypothetical protein ACJ8AN_02960 [Archangium sp.]